MNGRTILTFIGFAISMVTANRYPIWPFEFHWNVMYDLIKTPGYNCTSLNEPMQPPYQFWKDNYLCHFSNGSDIIDPGFKWSTNGMYISTYMDYVMINYMGYYYQFIMSHLLSVLNTFIFCRSNLACSM